MSDLPTALGTACTTGDLSLAKSLYGDLVHANPSSKASVLYQMGTISARNDQSDILSFCFAEGLEIDPGNVNDPFIYAAYACSSVAVFRVLLDNGIDVNKYQELGGSPLVAACEHGNVELAAFLLDHGADPNNGYFVGEWEALIWAIVGDKASLNMVRLLLERGTKVKGTGALIAAAEHGNLRAVELLLENGDLDLEEVEEYGSWDHRKLDNQGTALYKAAEGGHMDILETLIRQGADTKFRDRTGRSIAERAEENGHGDAARRIRNLEGVQTPCLKDGEELEK